MTDEIEHHDWLALASSSRKAVEDAIEKVSDIFRTFDAIEIISRVALFVHTSLPGENKESGGPARSETNLEYLVSLMTALNRPCRSLPPTPDVVMKTIELVTEILLRASVYHSAIQHNRKEHPESIGELAHSFRMSRMHVRGDGYWPHLRQTAKDLLQPYDEILREKLGFSYAEYLVFMDRTELQIESRFREEIERLGGPYQHLMSSWNLTDPEVLHSEKFAKFVEANADEIALTKADFDLIGTSSIYQIEPLTPAEHSIVRRLSTSPSTNLAFQGKNPEQRFWPLNSSETDMKPILFADGSYYAFNIQKLQREAFTLIGDLLRQEDETLWKNKFLKHRDEYLERETGRIFEQALPHAKVFRKVPYPNPNGGETEADLVIICDGILMIVECKAGRLDPATWRGGEQKILKDMKKTVAGALNQAERFVAVLMDRGHLHIQARDQKLEKISAASFQFIFTVSVTLELVSSATSTLWEIEDAGLVGDTTRSWAVCLNDLRVISEVLDHPATFFHYLIRRLDTKSMKRIEASDELDYMMYYIEQGLFFHEANTPEEGAHITLGNWTDPLDQYYRMVADGQSSSRTKPKVPLGKQTKRVIDILTRQRPHNWLVGCLDLLEFDLPVREELLGKIRKHLQIITSKKAPFALSFIASHGSTTALALITSRNPSQIKESARHRCYVHMRDHGITRLTAIVFGIPISAAPCEVMRIEYLDHEEIGPEHSGLFNMSPIE